ncbi:sensor histidine kinase [Microbispora sp. NBC_01389]|uniref:sensor histidine kinase n=1 Tax=Microbispora sp. NBC_01389 TaxID=2903584 RepID=UPI003250C177
MTATRTGAGRRIGNLLLAASVVLACGALVGVVGGGLAWTEWVRAVEALLLLGVGVVGSFVVHADPRNASGWLMLAGSLGDSATAFGQVWITRALAEEAASVQSVALVAVISAVGSGALIGMGTLGILLFPTGRPPSARWRPISWSMIVLVAVLVVSDLFASKLDGPVDVSNPLSPAGSGQVFDLLLLAGVLLCPPATTLAAVAVTVRYRGTSDERVRRALRLVIVVAWLWAGSWLVCLPLAAAGDWAPWLGSLADILLVLFAVATWVGIVRYGLLDIKFVLSRALAYGVLTAIALIAYAAVVWLLGVFVAGWARVDITIVVAVFATLPLRDLVQRRVNLLVYGMRSDPASVLTRLAQRLGDAASPDDALPAALRTLAEVFGLRYAAVEVAGATIVSYGAPGGEGLERVSLPFASEVIGHLVIEGGAADDPIGRSDRALLDRLAPQLGVTARSALLARALRESRDRLIVARDEERRRIRRDLHDGLGPTLAGMVLDIEHASRHLTEDPGVAERALTRLHTTAQEAVTDVRRLVYALRPPAIDALGLAGAIREQAERLGASGFETDELLPPLPAAVENATYLIALEAMTNAATHARHGPFRVHLAAGEALELEVADDGPGLPAGYRPGVGIQSMRERAAELGGSLCITDRNPRGTLVRLLLPLTVGVPE